MSDSYRSVRKFTSEMPSFGIYTFSKSNFCKNKNLLIDISYNRSSNTAGLFFHLLSGANNDPFWHTWINCVIPWTYCCLTSGKHWPLVRKNLTRNWLKQSFLRPLLVVPSWHFRCRNLLLGDDILGTESWGTCHPRCSCRRDISAINRLSCYFFIQSCPLFSKSTCILQTYMWYFLCAFLRICCEQCLNHFHQLHLIK